MVGDVDLIVTIVDFIEKRLHARKYSGVDSVAFRIPDLPDENVVRLFVECLTTVDESWAQLGAPEYDFSER